MDIVLAICFFAALLAAGYFLAKRKRKPPARPPVERDDIPKDYDGSGGWFGRKDG